ncbi:MAG: hypothetical protein A2Y97_03555 [Nitrospirae bacterium RBG_13_39_12]|nr:MAG: hypothetical protein A2Y97_03555 [Nitrospirae bacterium RBG_13_39_12]
MKQPYFKRDQDLNTCSLFHILVISSVHRITGKFRRSNIVRYPYLFGTAIAFSAHRFFHLFDFAYRFRNVFIKINQRIRKNKSGE